MNSNKRIEMAEKGTIKDLKNLISERDSRLISAMLTNPNMTSGLVVQLIRKKWVSEQQIVAISQNFKWIKDYRIKLEILVNPLTPRNISLKFLHDIMIRDLAVIARKVTLHPVLREAAVNYLKLRLDTMRTGEKITLARSGPTGFLQTLMNDKDSRVLSASLSNYRLTEEDLLQFLAPSTCKANKLEIVLSDEKWGNNPRIVNLLACHKNLAYASRRKVFEQISLPFLLELTESPVLTSNHRTLACFVARQRLKVLPKSDLIQLASSPSKVMLYFVGITMEDENVASVWINHCRNDIRLMKAVCIKNNHSRIRDLIQYSLDKSTGHSEF